MLKKKQNSDNLRKNFERFCFQLLTLQNLHILHCCHKFKKEATQNHHRLKKSLKIFSLSSFLAFKLEICWRSKDNWPYRTTKENCFSAIKIGIALKPMVRENYIEYREPDINANFSIYIVFVEGNLNSGDEDFRLIPRCCSANVSESINACKC